MEKVTITVQVRGEELTRDYIFEHTQLDDEELIGSHVADLIAAAMQYAGGNTSF